MNNRGLLVYISILLTIITMNVLIADLAIAWTIVKMIQAFSEYKNTGL